MANRLGISIQSKYIQIVGYFPKQPTDVPDTPVHYLADQLDLSMSDFDGYDWHGRTDKRHRTAILQFLNINRSLDEACGIRVNTSLFPGFRKLHPGYIDIQYYCLVNGKQ